MGKGETQREATDYLFTCRDGYLFWTDVAKKSINRAHLNGSSRTTLVKSSVKSPGEMQYCTNS